MANAAPAKTIITSTTGPGQSVTALTFTDVLDLEVNFVENTIKVTRSGSNGISYYDYSAMATVTWSISGGATTVTITS